MLDKTIDHPIIHALQRKHFVLLDVLPLTAFPVALALLWRLGTAPSDWVAFGVFYGLGVVGIELGYHRYYSHGAFGATAFVRGVLLILGSIGGQGPVVTWASTHRYHHAHSDGPLDLHSPHSFRGRDAVSLRSLIHAQLTWKWTYSYPNPSLYTPQLMRDRLVLRLSKLYYLWVVLGVATPGLLSYALSRGQADRLLTGMLLGGVVRLVVTQHMTFLINSLCHCMGPRPFQNKDESRNLGWLSPLTLGGSLHNAHHAFPTTANNALTRWDIDPGYWLLRVLAVPGWVWELKHIPAHVVERRKRNASDALAPAIETSGADINAT